MVKKRHEGKKRDFENPGIFMKLRSGNLQGNNFFLFVKDLHYKEQYRGPFFIRRRSYGAPLRTHGNGGTGPLPSVGESRAGVQEVVRGVAGPTVPGPGIP